VKVFCRESGEHASTALSSALQDSLFVYAKPPLEAAKEYVEEWHDEDLYQSTDVIVEPFDEEAMALPYWKEKAPGEHGSNGTKYLMVVVDTIVRVKYKARAVITFDGSQKEYWTGYSLPSEAPEPTKAIEAPTPTDTTEPRAFNAPKHKIPSKEERRLLLLQFDNDHPELVGERCHASRGDVECFWALCPQELEGEPEKSGRHCPLDRYTDEDE
jgi:hypothetical protein